MAEENLVELDTDDVKEETISTPIQVKEEPVKTEEVDLGYTDPIQKNVKATSKEETTKEETTTEKPKTENLEEVTTSVQKRIDNLTRK